MSTDTEMCLAWLAQALQQLRPEGRTKVVGYLEAVLEEVVFETKMVPEAYPRGVTYPSEGVQRMGRGCLFWLVVSVVLSVTLTVVVNLFLFVLSGQPVEEGADDTLGQRQAPRPGCCIVVPIGCLMSVMLILVFSGLAVAQLLQSSIDNLSEHRAKQEAMAQKMNANSDRCLYLTPQKRTLSGPEYERDGRMEGDMQERTVQREDGREVALKLFFGRICCVVGLLLSVGGFVVATLGASVNLSAGAVGIGLGVLGYFLGARRLGAASVILGTAAIFFMAAASTGLIPGVTPLGHGYD